MQIISSQIKDFMGNSSFIRKMFETGIELKKRYGADNVYDFSLGNPDLPPPEDVGSALGLVSGKMNKPFALGYMNNAGYPEVRAAVAKSLSEEQGVKVEADNIVLTCGAAGAINVFFRAILDPGDEVICPAPYFVEYGFYVSNFGGTLRPVKSKPLTFELDFEALEQAFTPKTRAVLINSPNNPSGQIYSRSDLEKLSALLQKYSQIYGRPIYLVSDEPYRFLNYDNLPLPSVFDLYQFSVIVSSYSKKLSLAGARIGYFAANPAIPAIEELMSAVIMTNRILGFVNAPAIAQQVLLHTIGNAVDIAIYRDRRNTMAEVLDAAGIVYALPRGAFYFFPQSPIADDVAFVQALLAERILAVPGSGFGYPGYFRLAFCTDIQVIRNSRDAFVRAVRSCQ
jgi:aspartate aminotransferase